MNQKKIYILLTRFPDAGSKVIEAFTGFPYTHASIGLGEDLNTFYSFVAKGFIVEEITRYAKPGRPLCPCQLYELEVSARVYAAVKRVLQIFLMNKGHLHYTRLGVFFCLLRIPHRQKNHYFCSQFVAEVLKHSRAARLRASTTLYRPGDFRHLPGMRLHFQGTLQSMLIRFQLAPRPA